MYSEIYKKNVFQTNIQLSPLEYNQDIDLILLEKLKEKVEGKCDSNGYIRNNSCKIIGRSMGELQQGQFNGSCLFSVKYTVEICVPVEGDIFKCIVKNKNKMGLFCELAGIEDSPLNIILAKQHHLDNDNFDNKNPNDIIDVEIVGVKIEYRETNISCIGFLKDTDESIKSNEINNTIVSEDDEDNLNDEDDINDEDDLINEDNLDDITVKENKNITDLMDINISNNDLEEQEEFDVGEKVNLDSIEGVQNMDGIEKNLNEKTQGDSELEELGEDFEGEMLDLEDMGNEDIIPVYNTEEYEYYEEPIDKNIYNLKTLTSNQYKTFPKPRKTAKNYLNYFIYVQLNNIMLEFYDKNGREVKKIMLGKKNKYNKEIKVFLSKLGKSLKVEDVDGLTHVL